MKRKISSEDKLKCDIIENTKAIRQKFKKLKLSNARKHEVLNNTLKPLVEPLQKVISDKKEILEELKDLKTNVYSHKEDKKKDTFEKYDNNEEDPIINLEGAQKIFSTPLGYKNAQSRAREFGVFAAKYVLLLLQPDESNKLDKVYGIRSDGNRWLIGNSVIQITDDNIYIDDEEFKGSPGVFELLFMKHPDKSVYNDQDLETYKKILQATNAHKQNYDEKHQVMSNRGKKYTKIIKPLFGKQTGSGMEANKIRYEYWDDPNELVVRLRLILSSTSAGNNSHQNEIMSIIEELKEINILE